MDDRDRQYHWRYNRLRTLALSPELAPEPCLPLRVVDKLAAYQLPECEPHLNAWLDELSRSQREVIRLRYGLDGQPPMLLGAIASWFSVTPQRIQQVEMSALEKLRRVSAVRIFRPDVDINESPHEETESSFQISTVLQKRLFFSLSDININSLLYEERLYRWRMRHGSFGYIKIFRKLKLVPIRISFGSRRMKIYRQRYGFAKVICRWGNFYFWVVLDSKGIVFRIGSNVGDLQQALETLSLQQVKG